MFQEVLKSFTDCDSAICLAWHVSLALGALLLGVWAAYEIWCRPWRNDTGEVRNLLEPRTSGTLPSPTLPVRRIKIRRDFGFESGGVPEGGMSALQREMQEAKGGPEPSRGELESDITGVLGDDALAWQVGETGGEPGSGIGESLGVEGAVATSVEQGSNGEPGADDGIDGSRESLAAAAMSAIRLRAEHAREEEAPERGTEEEGQRGAPEGSFDEPEDGRLEPGDPFFGEHGEYKDGIGFIYLEAPKQVDDLTLLEGVDPRIERQLQQAGIYRFRQIARWDEELVATFSKRMGLGAVIEEAGWVTQAEEMDEIMTGMKDPSYEVPPSRDQEGGRRSWLAGEPVRLDPKLGLVFTSEPEVVDPLDSVDGIDEVISAALVRLGICRFAQIHFWDRSNALAVGAELGLSKGRIEGERWPPQAGYLHRISYRGSRIWAMANPTLREYEARIAEAYAGEDVRVDPDLGIVYRSKPGRVDPLERVEGVGELMADWLQACGVYRFQQIGDWSESNVRAFAERLDLPGGRIFSERWIAQARRMSSRRF